MYLIACLQPDAIGLTDAFDFTDYDLNSALGCYDGKVCFEVSCCACSRSSLRSQPYERLYEWSKRSPLNKTQVADGYEEFLRPLIKSRL